MKKKYKYYIAVILVLFAIAACILISQHSGEVLENQNNITDIANEVEIQKESDIKETEHKESEHKESDEGIEADYFVDDLDPDEDESESTAATEEEIQDNTESTIPSDSGSDSNFTRSNMTQFIDGSFED